MRWWRLSPLLLLASNALPQVVPKISVGLEQASTPQEASVAMQVVFLLTILSLAPAILLMMTPFTRIVTVMGFLKKALGTQTTPPNQIIVGLSLFLTWFVLQPQLKEMNDLALQPYLAQEITWREGVDRAMKPMRAYMLRQTGENELATMVKISKTPRPRTVEDIPDAVLIPSYMISELKTAFLIGFLIYLPFLVIDMVVASILMALGMMMLPPVMVSLPLKLILFVSVDGWNLVTHGLVQSFR